MMYRDNYAAAVMVDGKVQAEDKDGTVVLPFETEYQIRLKNKNRKRAVADIFIDGREAAKGVVVDSLGTIDLERFVADLNKGNRFKIVKANDARVDQPGESENGMIHVNFYPEKDKPVVVTKIVEEVHCHGHRHIHCVHNCCPNTCFWCGSHSNIFYTSSSPVYGSYTSGNVQAKGLNAGNVTLNASMSGGGTTNDSAPVESVNNNVVARSMVNQVAEAAATVEGSLSTQKFVHVNIDVDYDKCTTLQIKLKGVKSLVDECSCGYRSKPKEHSKHCPDCGQKFVVEIAA